MLSDFLPCFSLGVLYLLWYLQRKETQDFHPRKKAMWALLLLLLLLIVVLLFVLFLSTEHTPVTQTNPQNVMISMTTTPNRQGNMIAEVLDTLVGQAHVLICVPATYKKWPDRTVALPPHFYNHPRITIFEPLQDYGPATKLLGALEFLNRYPQETSHIKSIITADDDQLYSSLMVNHLLTYSETFPESVITQKGISLDHYPYKSENGLHYGRIGRVDCPRGYMGVLYPVSIAKSPEFFDMVDGLPKALRSQIFSDDDAYFGAVLGRIGCPIESVQSLDIYSFPVESEVGAGQTRKSRIQNEMEIYQELVQKKILPNPRKS